MRLTVEPSTDPSAYDFAHDIRVRFAETDAMGVVHHGNYVAYFEEARVAYLRAIGHPFTEWRAAGLESPVVEAFVSYRRPLEFDEVMTVHLRLAAITRATFQLAYLVVAPDETRKAEVRATGVTVHGCVTTDGRPTRLPTWLTELGKSLA
ncbi:MAG: acyl-CoA thioesterase [Ilumatobacteraceae bacterium]